jgi:ferredoxin
MKIEIDQDNCIGCGSCAALAPETFAMNQDGKSEVQNEKGSSDEETLEAAKSCPVSVIHLTDDDGKKVYPE